MVGTSWTTTQQNASSGYSMQNHQIQTARSPAHQAKQRGMMWSLIGQWENRDCQRIETYLNALDLMANLPPKLRSATKLLKRPLICCGVRDLLMASSLVLAPVDADDTQWYDWLAAATACQPFVASCLFAIAQVVELNLNMVMIWSIFLFGFVSIIKKCFSMWKCTTEGTLKRSDNFKWLFAPEIMKYSDSDT